MSNHKGEGSHPPRPQSSEGEEEDVYEEMLKKSGCMEYHYKLQDCFHDNGGDWRKCRKEMSDFKECMKNNSKRS